MGDVQGDLAKDAQARGRNPYGSHLRRVLDTCKQCGGSGRFVIPPLPGQTEPQVDEDCARCEGSGKEADAERIARLRRTRAVDEWLAQPPTRFSDEESNAAPPRVTIYRCPECEAVSGYGGRCRNAFSEDCQEQRIQKVALEVVNAAHYDELREVCEHHDEALRSIADTNPHSTRAHSLGHAQIIAQEALDRAWAD